MIFCYDISYSGTFKVKAGLAQMAKGGIIMDVTNAEEARIAEEAGVKHAHTLTIGPSVHVVYFSPQGSWMANSWSLLVDFRSTAGS